MSVSLPRTSLVLLALATPLPADALESCLGLEPDAARLRCVEDRAARGAVSEAEFEGLLSGLAARTDGYRLVLAVLGRDDGTVRVSWRPGPDGPAWETSVAPGMRLARGARAVVESGRSDEARAWIGRLIELGDRDWAVEAWHAHDWGPPPGGNPEALPLDAPVWSRSLPDLGVDLFDGGRFEFAEARGKVLIIDFWATWCPPCLEELPHLQHLVNELSDDGLTAVAINAGESRDVAMGLVSQIGLTLPVGAHSRELDRFFGVGSLPTVILVDRDGRIRERWSGFGPGGEKPIAELARRVVAGEPPRRLPVAEAVRGFGRLRAVWVKPGQTEIDGLAVLPVSGGPDLIAVSRRNGQLAVLDGSGDAVHRVAGFFAGALRSADLNGDGYPEVVGFSPGGTELEILDLRGDSRVSRTTTAPVFDVLARTAAGEHGPGLLVAATDGLHRLGPTGENDRRIDGIASAYSVVSAGGDGAGALALDGDGAIHRVETAARGLLTAPRGAWRLFGSSYGWGVAPAQVLSAAVGRFAPKTAATLALATDDDQLVLLDTTDGATVFRGHWPGVRKVAAGDIDGDGRDELVVADELQVTVLEGVAGG